jgi:DNA-binding transcriptional ArsR family regulator
MVQAADPSVFDAIADPTRRELLDLLRQGERTAGELAEPFDVTRSRISQHLGVLLDAGLVERRKDGRRRMYRLRAEPLEEVERWVGVFSDFWDSRLRGLGAYLDREKA